MSLVEEFNPQAEDREDQATDMKDYVNILNNEWSTVGGSPVPRLGR